MKKLINISDKIHNVLKEYKEKYGISVTAYIQRAIFKQMISDKLIIPKTTVMWIDKKTGSVLDIEGICEKCSKHKSDGMKIEVMDESLKYCDGDKCGV